MALRQPCLIGSQFARVGYAVRPALTDPRGGGYLLRGIKSDPKWDIRRPEALVVTALREVQEPSNQMGKVTPETRILRG